jgi:cytoskeleton protein RodZ
VKEQPALGSHLRALREERNVSLEEMSFATRVGIAQLEALEADNAALLPAPVFVKGFIRAYCHFLGLPPDEALERYRRQTGSAEPTERAVAIPRARPAMSSSASAIVMSVVLLVVLGAGLLAFKLAFSRPSAPAVVVAPTASVEPPTKFEPPVKAQVAAIAEPKAKVEPAPKVEANAKAEPEVSPPAKVESATAEPPARSESAKTEVFKTEPPKAEPPARKIEPTKTAAPPRPEPAKSAEPVAKVATAASAAPTPPATPSATAQRLVVKANELTWLRIQSDDGTAAEALLPAGSTREWTAERRFVLTVGNAGGVELTLNGQPMPPLGAKGAVRKIELPRAEPASGS